jgi:hypothetical protein
VDITLRAGACILGLALIVIFFQSICRVAVINRHHGDRVARVIGSLIWSIIARPALRRRSYDRIQDVLAWILPSYMFLLIGTWFALVQAGFTLLIWSLQAEPRVLEAFIASGSALSTLGFLTPSDVAGQLLAIPEGAMGLGIVVFFFTFIPGYQTAVQVREMKVAWLYARVGHDPGPLSLIDWLQQSQRCGDLQALWDEWEEWFRLLIATHTLAPVVAFVPSLRRGQSWLSAAAVVLDTASFCISALEGAAGIGATLCHTTGAEALTLIAVELRARSVPAQLAPSSSHLRATFDATFDRFAAAGTAVQADRDACWQRFTALRCAYGGLLPKLAARLIVPLDNNILLPTHCL